MSSWFSRPGSEKPGSEAMALISSSALNTAVTGSVSSGASPALCSFIPVTPGPPVWLSSALAWAESPCAGAASTASDKMPNSAMTRFNGRLPAVAARAAVDHDPDLAGVLVDLHLDEVVAAADRAELRDHLAAR